MWSIIVVLSWHIHSSGLLSSLTPLLLNYLSLISPVVMNSFLSKCFSQVIIHQITKPLFELDGILHLINVKFLASYYFFFNALYEVGDSG